ANAIFRMKANGQQTVRHLRRINYPDKLSALASAPIAFASINASPVDALTKFSLSWRQAHETHSPCGRSLFSFAQCVRANASPDAGREARVNDAATGDQVQRANVADSSRNSLQQRRRLHRAARR